MAKLLPQIPGSYFIIYLDNYFTSIPLFRKLRSLKIGVYRTTRPGIDEFPPLFAFLNKKYTKAFKWGTLYAAVLPDVLDMA